MNPSGSEHYGPPAGQSTPYWGGPPPYGGASPPRPRPRHGRSFILHIILGILGMLSYLLGLAPYADITEILDHYTSNDNLVFLHDDSIGIAGTSLLLAAGLIALFSLLPKQSGNGAVIAALSVTGFISLAFVLFALGGAPPKWGLILGLIIAFVQAAVAVAALLIDAGVLQSGNQNAYSPVDARPRGGPPPSGGGALPPYRGPGHW